MKQLDNFVSSLTPILVLVCFSAVAQAGLIVGIGANDGVVYSVDPTTGAVTATAQQFVDEVDPSTGESFSALSPGPLPDTYFGASVSSGFFVNYYLVTYPQSPTNGFTRLRSVGLSINIVPRSSVRLRL
jgi:hypothetical protein